ncbi:glycosyltransferase [Candidatus Roizmanbacteria bacterium CG_4_10_14_0_8_um_filter_33_9]|uniref:Glycosyltransferase n=1 Tax=Candidatus Roizmanbacteria bacterium CG_4_10_14_0_8_um_filter_33_9 TaxID=1974826 RepID=A0A2M7QH75_9BACT|nr:MAG: glycosyltransferase [Candidatus Roizmanbacteria bacterium CG_4_10_14_0_8_um_filter_33_9]
MKLAKISILNTYISNVTLDYGLEEVEKWLKGGVKKYKIFTPNPEIVVLGQKDGPFEKIINSADLALPDGSGLVWASKLLGTPLKERIAGVDFVQRLCGICEQEGFTIGLIGGRVGVAVKTAECLQKMCPKLKITLVESWDPEISADKISELHTKIDLLFVAYGQGKQEKWIAENLPKIPVKVAMGVGGAFDYISGTVPRAPKFMRDYGFEWLFRLVVQPWRIKRQVIGGRFFLLILREWVKKVTTLR